MTTMGGRRMRVGVYLPTYGVAVTPEAICETALLAEELGFDSLFFPDHVVVAQGEPEKYETIYEAVSTLAWLAGLTQRVQLGTSVLVAPLRNPVVLAKQLATIDRYCGGRLIVGVGCGWSRAEFDYVAVPFERRGRLLDEAISVLRHLWQDPSAAFESENHRLSGQAFGPSPRQPGGPPIWIGGHSEAALRRAARVGDAWHGGDHMCDPAKFEVAARRVASLAEGRPVGLTLIGHIGPEAGEVVNRGHSWNPTRYVIGGSDAQVTDHLSRLAQVGCSHIVLNFYDADNSHGPGDIAAMQERVTRFAEQILPAL